METKTVIKAQYHAALKMLEEAVIKCPETVWDSSEQKNRFWHIAYHALFYTHLYLQPSEKTYRPWIKHREEYEFMGPPPWAPDKEPSIGEAYNKDEILEFSAYCHSIINDTVDMLDLEGESGFFWLEFSKLELQFYNIRHLQQHTGELCERLGTQGIDVGWVGSYQGE
jgi:hypothetical protein